MAYDAASAKPGSTLELAEYVELMCGIIDTHRDVDILKKAKIIEGELPDEEIVRVFNGIRKSTGENSKAQSNIEQPVENVNKRYDDVGIVKVKRFLKKCLVALVGLGKALQCKVSIFCMLISDPSCFPRSLKNKLV